MRSADTVADRKHAKLNLAAIASRQMGTMQRSGKFPPARQGLASAWERRRGWVKVSAAETAETLGQMQLAPNTVGAKFGAKYSWGQCKLGPMQVGAKCRQPATHAFRRSDGLGLPWLGA